MAQDPNGQGKLCKSFVSRFDSDLRLDLTQIQMRTAVLVGGCDETRVADSS